MGVIPGLGPSVCPGHSPRKERRKEGEGGGRERERKGEKERRDSRYQRQDDGEDSPTRISQQPVVKMLQGTLES